MRALIASKQILFMAREPDGMQSIAVADHHTRPFWVQIAAHNDLGCRPAVGVSCEMADLADIAPREERCKEIRATVASLRIDSIAASGFGSSRSRAAADIAADKMKLNWQPVKSASQMVKEGDIISMRGRGRLEVAEVRGQTKKGRTVVVLKRYI